MIARMRREVESLLTNFDKRWTILCDGDTQELTEWASRMRLIRAQFDEIDRNLAVAGSRLFDWDKVSLAMSFINSFRVAAEQVLAFNERVPA